MQLSVVMNIIIKTSAQEFSLVILFQPQIPGYSSVSNVLHQYLSFGKFRSQPLIGRMEFKGQPRRFRIVSLTTRLITVSESYTDTLLSISRMLCLLKPICRRKSSKQPAGASCIGPGLFEVYYKRSTSD